MNRTFFRTPLAAFASLVLTLIAVPASAQTTFTACRVPDVGAIYMVGVSGAPSDCLDPSHVKFSWTEGGSGTVADGSVSTAKLADGAVTSAKIADGAATEAKLSFDPATQTELDALASGLSTAGTVNDAANPVDWSRIKNMPADFADGVDASGGAANDISCAGCVDASDIADHTITPTQIQAESIGAGELMTGAVATDEIADGTIGAADLDNDIISAVHIVDGEVGSAELADGAVTSAKIADGTIQTADLADSLVTADNVASNQRWAFTGSTGTVSLWNNLAPGLGTVLLGTFESSAAAGPQIRFDGSGAGFWDIGQDASGDFVLEINDAAQCTLSGGQWSCPAAVANDAVGSAQVADNSLTADDLAAGSVGTSELNLEVVTSNPLVTNNTTGTLLTPSCPSGKYPISAGVSDASGIELDGSYAYIGPYPYNGSVWAVDFVNVSGVNKFPTFYTVCITL